MMMDSNPIDSARRDAERAGGQTPRSVPTAPATAGHDAATHTGVGSSEHAGAASASPIATSPPSGGLTLPRADRPQSRPSDGSRNDASHNAQRRDDGMPEVVRRLLHCIELVVQEIPRGAAARFDGVTDELRKARESLDRRASGSDRNASSGRAEGSRDASKGAQSASPTANGGSDHAGISRDDTPSKSPASPTLV